MNRAFKPIAREFAIFEKCEIEDWIELGSSEEEAEAEDETENHWDMRAPRGVRYSPKMEYLRSRPLCFVFFIYVRRFVFTCYKNILFFFEKL